jgi:alpha-mannosidase
MTLSNADLAFAKLGNSTHTKLDTQTPQIHVLAGGQVDGSWLGIRGQNGQSSFLQRFALKPHDGYNAAQSMRFALEHQNPLVTGAIISKKESLMPEKEFALLKVADPNVLLLALKVSEEGITNGIVARLWNLSNTATDTSISMPLGIGSAQQVTHIETPIEKLKTTETEVNVRLRKRGMATYLLQPELQLDGRP